MKKRELEKYKEVLLELRKECLAELEQMESNSLRSSQREAAGELSGYTQHMADMASDSYEIERSINFIDKESNLLYEIEEALYRIERGEFGQCEGCKKPIDKKRINAMPYARYCIECQIKREKKA